MRSLSFGIKTNLRYEHKTHLTIHSILAQNIDTNCFEILITGNCEFRFPPNGHEQIRYLPDLPSANNGLLAKMMNTLAAEARFETVILLDDDMVLTDGWFESFQQYTQEHRHSWDILAFPIRNTDGSRFWDWSVHTQSTQENILIPTDLDSSETYVSGGLVAFQKHVWKKVPWNAELGFYEAEDVDWSTRARKAGYKIDFCAHAYAMHNDGRYYQVGNRVHRSQSCKEIPRRLSWSRVVENYLRSDPRHEEQLGLFLDKPYYMSIPRAPTTSCQPFHSTTPQLSDQLTIIWCARLGKEAEYAEDARNYLAALQRARVPALLCDLETGQIGGGDYGLSVNLLHSANGDLVLHSTSTQTKFMVVVHERPDLASHIIVRGAPCIGYFDIRLPHLPFFWGQYLHKYTQIWVPTHTELHKITPPHQDKAYCLPRFLETHFHNPDYPSPTIDGLKETVLFTSFRRQSSNDIGSIIRCFLKSFTHKDDITLLVNLPRGFSPIEFRQLILNACDRKFPLHHPSAPDVKFIYQDLKTMDRIGFYNLCDAYIYIDETQSLDRTVLEAMTSGKTVVSLATEHSEDQQLLSPQYAFLAPRKLHARPPEDTSWHSPQPTLDFNLPRSKIDEVVLCTTLKEALRDKDELKKRGCAARKQLLQSLEPDNFIGRFQSHLGEIFYPHPKPEGQMVTLFVPPLASSASLLGASKELSARRKELDEAIEWCESEVFRVTHSKEYTTGIKVHLWKQKARFMLKLLSGALLYRKIKQKVMGSRISDHIRRPSITCPPPEN
ncbi:MAG: glycosyltransferase [Zetaproteobacteria bacterium]|nr:glycosyltransferase [Zetaproteobacteria bacterium]